MTRIVNSLADISSGYSAAFVDIWGCIHDGLEAFPEAISALRQFREAGKPVILVTNSPRPWAQIAEQLEQMGAGRGIYDAIASSGDSARAAMFRGIVGQKLYFIGQPQDSHFFEPMAIISDPVPISLVPLTEAEGIICTGPEDPLADPEIYRPQFLLAKQLGLKLLCANPDIVVDRGEIREWCAGALAELYTEMGGESLYFGKPHPPIYDLARRRLAVLDPAAAEGQILAIGDGIATDIPGAMGENIDSLFITGGLAREDTMIDGAPNAEAIDRYMQKHQTSATYAIGMLR